ncbi:hypothetical protein GALMADRAFT_239313 [Galerina marginata CBS 339.88]|uniref:Nuclear condensin complex subunit 3 C-terminal domain-containing protein n=1 Tax=Galerina marginata (strain CBS 339.88) TaxID=685588 RepID=A0A067TDZ7_GALM3|nr:hypothetical protein GALMADRAFT_239313 [Galerina marginata CBS 339.88]
MPGRTNETVPKEPDREDASLAIAHIFEQAQVSTANHRKNCVALHKLHCEFADYKELLNKGRLQKLTGERQFQALYEPLVMRVLPVKKGVPSADRVVKFVAGYIKFINEKAAEDTKEDSGSDDDNDDDDTTASRFTAHLLKLLLKGFIAKDKNVRYRVLQSIAEMISHLGQIDEDIYTSLRAALIDRIHDKESSIRSQAVISLAKLCVSEDPADLNGESSILDTLLDSLAHDPSSDVRRTVLLTIPINGQTLDAVLDRTRDTDATIRKIVYSGILATKTRGENEEDKNMIGPTHPRTLTIAQRELIVQNGLGDRDPSVRTAAGTLIATWVDVLEEAKDEDLDIKVEAHAKKSTIKFEDGILSLLTLFDFGEGTITEDALLSVFRTRVDIFNNIEFNGPYWANLTPEKAFLARVFVEHCKNNKDEARLEATLPVVTVIAFRIQEAYNSLDDLSILPGSDNDDERNQREDARIAKELVISELLKLAIHLDYSDEIGRRKTSQLVRDMLRTEALPENLMAPCLDVLRTLAPNERELIRLVVETIQELRDTASGEAEETEELKEFEAETSFEEPAGIPIPSKSVDDMSPEQKARIDRIDLRCLSLCIGMLERINSTFEENSTLDGMLKELILPAVQRKEPIFRERGLKSLGLCCLIARPLALQSIGFFIKHVPASSSVIKITLLQSLFDSFMVHENALFKNQENNLEVVTQFLLTHILEEEDPKVKAILCEGTSKLILSGMITSIEAVKTLIKTYLSPLTTGNQELRQCLSFFFQMYSYSSSDNQKRMANIFIHVFLDISEDRKEARESDAELEIIGSTQVTAMFVDWTDPLRLSEVINVQGAQNGKGADECVQLSMAEDILRLLFEKDLKVDIEKEDKKILCQLLNKLHIPDVVDDYRIRSLKLLMDTLRMRRPLRDSACNTAFTKFELTITKKFEKQLEGLTEADYRKLEELNELFEFLDSIIPLDDDELIDIPRKGKKRRSESITSTSTTSRSVSPLPRKERYRPKSKRARLSASDGGDDNPRERGTPPPTAAPTRRLPKRAAATRKPVQVVVISSDSEGEGTPSTSRITGARSRLSMKKEEAVIDQQIDDLLASNATSDLSEIPYDSIMDPDSEEEEEVNDLLAED